MGRMYRNIFLLVLVTLGASAPAPINLSIDRSWLIVGQGECQFTDGCSASTPYKFTNFTSPVDLSGSATETAPDDTSYYLAITTSVYDGQAEALESTYGTLLNPLTSKVVVVDKKSYYDVVDSEVECNVKKKGSVVNFSIKIDISDSSNVQYDNVTLYIQFVCPEAVVVSNEGHISLEEFPTLILFESLRYLTEFKVDIQLVEDKLQTEVVAYVRYNGIPHSYESDPWSTSQQLVSDLSDGLSVRFSKQVLSNSGSYFVAVNSRSRDFEPAGRRLTPSITVTRYVALGAVSVVIGLAFFILFSIVLSSMGLTAAVFFLVHKPPSHTHETAINHTQQHAREAFMFS
jgi:hypothetical protein